MTNTSRKEREREREREKILAPDAKRLLWIMPGRWAMTDATILWLFGIGDLTIDGHAGRAACVTFLTQICLIIRFGRTSPNLARSDEHVPEMMSMRHGTVKYPTAPDSVPLRVWLMFLLVVATAILPLNVSVAQAKSSKHVLHAASIITHSFDPAPARDDHPARSGTCSSSGICWVLKASFGLDSNFASRRANLPLPTAPTPSARDLTPPVPPPRAAA
jgi:hypothetical protein